MSELTICEPLKPVAIVRMADMSIGVFGKIPNRFQRWMQKICFGIEWEVIKEKANDEAQS